MRTCLPALHSRALASSSGSTHATNQAFASRPPCCSARSNIPIAGFENTHQAQIIITSGAVFSACAAEAPSTDAPQGALAISVAPLTLSGLTGTAGILFGARVTPGEEQVGYAEVY